MKAIAGVGAAAKSKTITGRLKMKQPIKLLGLTFAISYILVVTGTWMYANHQGYVYFYAGDPIAIIKYIEWLLAFGSIMVLAGYIRTEWKNMNK